MTTITIDRAVVEQALKALELEMNTRRCRMAITIDQLEAQRDALLEALKGMRHKYGEYACSVCDHADAAIKAVEEGK